MLNGVPDGSILNGHPCWEKINSSFRLFILHREEELLYYGPSDCRFGGIFAVDGDVVIENNKVSVAVLKKDGRSTLNQ